MRTMLLGTAVALLLAGTLTACGGSDDPSGDATAATTVTETVTPSDSATPTPTSSPTPTTSPSPTASATTSSAAPAVAGCLTRNLAVTVTDGEGAAGSTYSKIVLTNKGSTACTTGGFGGVSYVQGESNTVVGAPAQRSGKGVTFTLQPGGRATAQLQETAAQNYPESRCRLTDVDGLKIYPPNETHPAYVQHPTQACANTAIKTLTLSPYKTG